MQRVPGTAVFLNRNKETTPLAMRASVEHTTPCTSTSSSSRSRRCRCRSVAADERLAIDDLGYSDDGITHVSARFGYMEQPDVPARLRCAAEGRRSSSRSTSRRPPTSSPRSSCAPATRPG